MPGKDYDFFTVWRVPGTVDEVLAILTDAEALPVWWPSVYLSVVPVPAVAGDSAEADSGKEDGDGDRTGAGQSYHLHTKGWLPYTLRWTMTPDGPVTREVFALSATGDLTGTGRWSFSQDGPETVITYHWQVSAGKPLLRRLGWLLKPVFSANHRWAMARGEESLTLELRRRRHAESGTFDDVPPPRQQLSASTAYDLTDDGGLASKCLTVSYPG
ncbi:SRPBCC family protein [Arthrobacter sp. SA17]